MTSRLTEIVENKIVEVQARKNLASNNANKNRSAVESGADIQLGDGSFVRALQKHTTNLICELKPKSPSAGVLKEEFDLNDILPHYQANASAISVLTDKKFFGGSLDLLKEVSEKTDLPTLCKDFVIDPYQCLEARLAGAQAVLLMVKILDEEKLPLLHKSALDLGLTPVVEVQNESELARALHLMPQVILINNRNLDTFEISLDTTIKLAPAIPDDVIKISASGFFTRVEIQSILPYCHNFLIGSSLMLAPDLPAKLKELRGANS